jgi:hypothetical protein
MFFEQYWGQQPLILLRGKPDYYAHLFAMRDVDSVLRFAHLKYPDLQLTHKDQHASPLAISEGMQAASLPDDGVPDVTHLYGAYAQGGMMFVHALQEHWEPIAALCRNLEQAFHHPVNADLYLVHRDSPGFRPHYHTYDDFVLQLEEVERWHTYDYTPQRALHPSNQPLPEDNLPPPAHEVDLQPGDLLYIPRGCVHYAMAPECSSLHLVLSIHAFTWADLFCSALASVSSRDALFHEPLPVGFLTPSASREVMQEQWVALLERFARGSTVEAAVEHLARRFISGMQPLPDGHFLHLDDLGQLDLDTTVAKRPGMVCWIARAGDTVSIQFPGNEVQGPASIESALRFIAAAGALRSVMGKGVMHHEPDLVVPSREAAPALTAPAAA